MADTCSPHPRKPPTHPLTLPWDRRRSHPCSGPGQASHVPSSRNTVLVFLLKRISPMRLAILSRARGAFAAHENLHPRACGAGKGHVGWGLLARPQRGSQWRGLALGDTSEFPAVCGGWVSWLLEQERRRGAGVLPIKHDAAESRRPDQSPSSLLTGPSVHLGPRDPHPTPPPEEWAERGLQQEG